MNNVRFGSMLMVLAMLSVPIVDGLAKYLSTEFSPLFISWLRYAIASCIIVPIAMVRFGRSIFPKTDLSAHFYRTLCLVGAMTLYFLALARIPMATATSAFFISPILAMLLAVFVLKEQITKPKLISLALGFIGMLLIAKPGAADQLGIFLAIGSGVAFAVYLIATRSASKNSDPIKTLTFQCVVGALILLPQALYSWQIPTSDYFILFGAMGLISVCSHLLSITAFRYAETSVLAPLVYLELVSSVIIGYFIFNDLPSASIAIGAVLIVLGGLIVTMNSK